MGLPTFAIVVTTIHDGGFLKHYAAAVREAADRVTMHVIPDRKTPAALYAAVEDYRSQGLAVRCPDLNEQDAFLARLGAPEGMFPKDTDHRRNVGYLMAYESGADVVISIDDDNLPKDGWLAAHEHALAAGSMPAETNPVGFVNPCAHLEMTRVGVWPRGFPYGKRVDANMTSTLKLSACEVAINEGLWIGEPDVDAITRLALHPQALAGTGPVILGPGMWAPVNSQNTAVRREVIPAYYFFRSARFGDIYQGYLAQACAKHLGHTVRFGTPVVRHERNDHDLLKDLEAELPDILRLDGWLDWLTAAKPEGSTYAEAYESLARSLFDDEGGLSRDRAVWLSMVQQMRTWLKLCGRLG